MRLLIIISALSLCFIQGADAQLHVEFSMDHSAGCSPLVVHFSPTVTGGGGGGTGGGGGGTGGGGGGTGGTGGTSDGAYTYLWDLGNGNTSSLAMPEAVYTSPGTYTVTLTVSNGSAVATATHNVTVYPPPSVSFTAGPAKVCGTPVTFTGNTDGGARTIVSWLWDFGDGSVSSAGPTTSHSYSQTGTAGASLTVTDNYGCTATLDQPALVQVFPALIAGFTSDKSVLCHVSDPVQFTNTSNGPGTLSYAWDFGDGTASGAASPGHVYSAAGSYGVKLTVTNSIGCTSTFSRSTPLNVASYHTDFSFPNPAVCQNSGIAFTDLSTPQATSRQWQIDGTTVSYFDPFSYYFSAPGTHTITLANVFGTCPQQASKSITVNPNPPSTPFSLTTQPGCNTYSVTLTDQSTGSFSRAWAQNYSTAPIFTPGSGASMSFSGFQYNAYYTVALLLTSTEGCSTTITEPVQLTQVFPSIRETSNAPINSCNLAITKTFAFNYAGTLQSFSWDLGDGTSSTDANPTHTYSTPGVYKTVLHYVDANGCSGTTNAIQTLIDKPFSLDFTAPTTVCVGSSVNFSSPSLSAENPL
ncbi:MAG TPA: PKD domain-containing protein [Puia sp.]|nr:PKD domain-containing protein [Puia sp.]